MKLPRWVHWVYAWAFRYFWASCPLCGKMFGGHEWRDRDRKSATIHILTNNLLRNAGICPDCTRGGKGGRVYRH